MRGDDPDGATVQLCLLLSGWPAAALGTPESDGRLSAIAAPVVVEGVSAPEDANETSLTDSVAEVAVSVFLDDRSITSGSHNFFTWCITPADQYNNITRTTIHPSVMSNTTHKNIG